MNVETEDMPEIGNFRAEISDMFLNTFIVRDKCTNYFETTKFLT
ncbi:hypothetical protein EMIT036CA2_10422 [Chryseobacterium sp. IT-36CA2]